MKNLTIEDWNKSHIIYKYQNQINKKIYIGQTTKKLKTRHSQHMNSTYNFNALDYNSPLHDDIREFGINSFSLEILFQSDDINILNEKETLYIKQFKSSVNENGYNISLSNEFINVDRGVITQIKNSIFDDVNLSFKAKGLLCVIISLNTQVLSEEILKNISTDSITSIKTALKELEDNGYLHRERVRNTKGQLKESIFHLNI